MSNIKRNDPCHCGSGKKYKQCHLKIDREADKERRQWGVAGTFLRKDLLQYARDERFTEAVAIALPFYWKDLYEADNGEEMSMAESLRFFDWFVFDYAFRGEDDTTTRLIDLYSQEKEGELSSHQEKVLAGWRAAMPASTYELTKADGQNLTLRDVVTSDETTIYEGAGTGPANIGDLILARIVPVNDRLEFSTNAAYLPQDEIGDLIETLTTAWEKEQAENEAANYAEFMRRHNHLSIHHALAQAELKDRPAVARLDPDRTDQKVTSAVRAVKRVKNFGKGQQKSVRNNKLRRASTPTRQKTV